MSSDPEGDFTYEENDKYLKIQGMRLPAVSKTLAQK